ncbi:TPLATE protein [Nymphaea thermarum]|nr:TPLATE protein [Nymphaea thermarum]
MDILFAPQIQADLRSSDALLQMGALLQALQQCAAERDISSLEAHLQWPFLTALVEIFTVNRRYLPLFSVFSTQLLAAADSHRILPCSPAVTQSSSILARFRSDSTPSAQMSLAGMDDSDRARSVTGRNSGGGNCRKSLESLFSDEL